MNKRRYIYVKSKELPSETRYPQSATIPVLPEWNRFTDYPKYSMVVYMGNAYLLRGTPNVIFVNVEGERYFQNTTCNKCKINKPKPKIQRSGCLSCNGYSLSTCSVETETCSCELETEEPQFLYKETYHRSHYITPDKDPAWVCMTVTEDGPEYVPAMDTFGDEFELEVEDR